ncbi:N-acetyl-gamma-glutamyl-phosphate reductase [Acidocella sp.]|uniref:N-acetyl-gamma-glutamyl-phosphate reductase n=1 Tax=Acidocella sp. TaxID=50710 RepID=UPI002631FF2E|nr:N-acetyl-gamma-glutamyl-phosphate reductase [Acidocella sp.]
MSARIFIDGQAGTTGLGITERLEKTGGFILLTLPESRRKDPEARAEAMSAADITVLCLPDDAAREAVALAPPGARILDASTAHRVAEGWVYGFAEMAPGQAELITAARLVANPGCYATGAIALLRPLTALGLMEAKSPVSINAVSGYTGGGKAMIAAHEAQGGPAFELYALGLRHKHLPEITRYARLARPPLFVPSVGHFPQGMLVCVPLFLDTLSRASSPARLVEAYADYYAGAKAVRVQRDIWTANLDPQELNGTDMLEIFICANEAAGQVLLIARLDNLGKGASGAAVQNIELMLRREA